MDDYIRSVIARLIAFWPLLVAAGIMAWVGLRTPRREQRGFDVLPPDSKDDPVR